MASAESIGLDPVEEPGPWAVDIDGDEIERLARRYSGALEGDDWESVRDTSANILSQCPSLADRGGRVTGLALGKVQSGKTLSYTALIALAIDNHYRVTVVLAGTKNPLLEQNYARLCQDLEASRPAVTPFRNPRPGEADVVRSVLHGGGHALIVILKNRVWLGHLQQLLSTPELCEQPTLIVDDEGDEASLNTHFRRGGTSAIYESILNLRSVLRHHAYIAYTATPQANLLISGIDGLSPDFGVLVEPGQGYCGGSVFFGETRDSYVRLVPDSEAQTSDSRGIPDGMRDAIAAFLVGGALRHLREQPAARSRHSMLIHNSNLRADHQRVQSDLQRLFELWRETLTNPPTDPSVQDLMMLFRAAYEDLCRTVDDAPRWSEVRDQLRDEVMLLEGVDGQQLARRSRSSSDTLPAHEQHTRGGKHAWARRHNRRLGCHLHHSASPARHERRHNGAASSLVRIQAILPGCLPNLRDEAVARRLHRVAAT